MKDSDIAFEDRRASGRNAGESPVMVTWTDRTGRYRRESAMLSNFSADGAELEFRDAIEEGTRILTEDEEASRWGAVRHATPEPMGGYRIGIQFESDALAHDELD